VARSLQQLAALPVTRLDALGPKRAAALDDAFGITSVLDLITHYPRRYVDRTNEARIRDLEMGQEAMVLVSIRRIQSRRTGPPGRGGRVLVTADVTDGSGSLQVTFFNQAWRERQLPPGTNCVMFGKVDSFRGRMQMTNPLVDLIGDRTGKIVAIYPQSEKERITSWEVLRWIEEALRRAGELADPVPADVRARFKLVDRSTAFRDIHTPETMAAAQTARRRLVFDELLRVQLALVMRKAELERTVPGIVHDTSGLLVKRFHDRLPFALTSAQQIAIDRIVADLGAPHPMHRLLQGDVGSGKTVVAVSALLTAVQGGHQGALMAPTEVLAEQHFAGIAALLEGFTVPVADENAGALPLFSDRPLGVALLTNRTTAAERRKLLAALEQGSLDLVVGTHALIQETVKFRSLGVAVIDEQHRFGVEQRAALRSKSAEGAAPDVLVMTATPIPRTAAMTVYGDLDVSVLDELPPGRTAITTHWVQTDADGQDEAEETVWAHVRAEVADGRQAYVVCPLIEESEKLEVRSAEETYERLTAVNLGELEGLTVALLHGRMPSADKESVMDRFRSGEVDVLVATTVIEVGVDVPNATVMVILDADRFGIAQLHQLRGRVGRGKHPSTCYLVGAGATEDGAARLEALVASTDGFELAEVDLDLRGEGTLMGERQKGRNDLKLASIRRDRQWVERAREVAIELIDVDPVLDGYPELRDEVDILLGGEDHDFLLKS
jgi:ATP-dependent DNA helicase RecG